MVTLATIFVGCKFWSDRPGEKDRDSDGERRRQFLCPFKRAYLIAYSGKGYETTIFGVPDRELVWIMERSKTLSEARHQEPVKWLGDNGYDVPKLRHEALRPYYAGAGYVNTPTGGSRPPARMLLQGTCHAGSKGYGLQKQPSDSAWHHDLTISQRPLTKVFPNECPPPPTLKTPMSS